jgi:hypothetical protein
MRTDPSSATSEQDDLAIEIEPDATDTPPDERPSRWLYYATGAAALVSIASAAILAVGHHWVPVGDHAIFAVRAHDVFSSHPPLLGTWTSASTSTSVNVNNPGPLYFDALAVPTAIFGSTNAGIAVGVALVNLVSAFGIGVVARRQGGYVVGAAAFTIVAVLAWTLGSEVLVEPVQPGALLMPMLLALMLGWGVARGDLVLLPWLVGVASFILQTYVTYVFLIGFLAVWAVVCVVLRLRASHWDPEQLRRVRKIGLISVLVGALCWVQPIYQQFFGSGPGNFGQLWKAARAPAKTFGPNIGTRLMADVVSLPPFWFRPSYHDFLAVDYVPKSSLPLAVASLLIVAALLALIARTAFRNTRDVAGTAAATGLVALLAGVVTAGRILVGLFGLISSHVFRWLWPLAAFVTFVFLVAVVQYLQRRVRPAAIVAGFAVIAVVFMALNLPTTDQNPDGTTSSIPVARDIGKQLSVLRGKGPLAVDTAHVTFEDVYPSYVLAALQHYGIDFKVNDENSLYQLGFRRRFDGSNARGGVFIRNGDFVDLGPPDSERVAVHYGLNPTDRAEMTTLQGEIAELMNNGTITLNDKGRAAIGYHYAQPPPTAPASMPGYVQSSDFQVLARAGALAIPPDAQQKVDRYVALHRDWVRDTVGVYLAPVSQVTPLAW